MRPSALLKVRRPHWLTVLAFGLLAYFSYHMVDGSRGLLAWRQVQAELAATRAELERVRSERLEVERRVANLRRTSLDPDLLDEMARKTLSLAGPGDAIILLDQEQAKQDMRTGSARGR